MYSCGKGKLSNWEKDLLTILRRNAKVSRRHGKQDGNLSLLWHIQSLRVTGKGNDLELNTPVGFKFWYVNGFFDVISKSGNSVWTALENFKLLQKHIFFCSQSLLLQWLRAFCFCLGDVQPCSAQCPPLLLLASSGRDKSDFEEFGLASSQHTCWAHCFCQTWVSVHGDTSPQATFPSVGAISSPVPNVLAWQCGGEPEQSWGSH